jgi:hypothetical protein
MIELDHGTAVFEARARLRQALASAGATLGARRASTDAGPHIPFPFAEAKPVEGASIRAVAVKASSGRRFDAGFVDGFQRFTVEGWVGTAPVLRAYTAAGVLLRTDGVLEPVGHTHSEVVVAPVERLPRALVQALREVGLPLVDCGAPDRQHPLLDVQLAVNAVETRRRAVEREVARAFRASFPDRWLVADGALGPLAHEAGAERLVGVIRSHETQYLAGVDLDVALTLEEGFRTTVFERTGRGGNPIYSWYLRLWDRSDHDILYGLIRVERPPLVDVVRGASELSGQLMAERAPLTPGEGQWDRLLYPIYQVDTFLRASAGGWL